MEYKDVIVDYPVLVRVPVIVLNGGGGYTTYPIFSGDQCLLMFCDRDIDLWLEKGVTNSPPNSDRIHDLSDAVALVGLSPITKPIPWATDGIVMAMGQTIFKITSTLASLVDSTGQRLHQSGFLQAYAGSSAPSGWLLCFGQAVSRSTYSSLFAIIGTTYGTGNGSTTFNLPDLRGKTIAGLDNMGGSDANVLTATFNPNRNTLGASTGQESHQLTIPEMPAHTHLQNTDFGPTAGLQTLKSSGSGNINAQQTSSTGGSTAHQNVQPTMMVNWIIKI